MSIMKNENNVLLQQARAAHNMTTGHVRMFIGANFIECEECGKHAHIPRDGILILHNADYSIYESIAPTDF